MRKFEGGLGQPIANWAKRIELEPGGRKGRQEGRRIKVWPVAGALRGHSSTTHSPYTPMTIVPSFLRHQTTRSLSVLHLAFFISRVLYHQYNNRYPLETRTHHRPDAMAPRRGSTPRGSSTPAARHRRLAGVWKNRRNRQARNRYSR